MILAFFSSFLLQTFCYGFCHTPPKTVSLKTIITKDGVSPFVYQYFQKFYEEFQEKGVDPLPNRSEVEELVAWSQRYFFKNELGLLEEQLDTVVDADLKQAFKMGSPDDFGNILSKENPLRGKVFVIPGCLVRSMHRLSSSVLSADLIFVASDDRLLIEKDFAQVDPIGGTDGAVLAIQRKQEEREQNQQTPLTEFDGAEYLFLWTQGLSGAKAHVIKNTKSVHEGEANAASLGKSFEGNMIVLKKFCEDNGVNFDGIVYVYPYGVDKKKKADQIFGRSIPFYDGFEGMVRTNRLFLNRLAAALYTEAEVKGRLPVKKTAC